MIWVARAAYPTAKTMQMPENLCNSNKSGAARAPQKQHGKWKWNSEIAFKKYDFLENLQ